MKSLGTRSSIVLTASVAAVMGTAGLCAYSMSKFAVRGLAATAALEYARFNIRVNAVAPGAVDTDMPKGLNDVQALVSSTPIGKLPSLFLVVLALSCHITSRRWLVLIASMLTPI
jgi:NAD(P)-dependent dehydrogenase (short-subunit alcohol dehydrogenase family)